ncbi:MAG TPA: nickel-dependent lactate racemase [Pyrinomonadaceae bacterium]|nr:nickel-dependent lactate racemase [Pyrinomonadaceae bacterium]
MKEISLLYGTRSLAFAFEENRFQIIAHDLLAQKPLSDAEIANSFDSPIESAAVEDLFSHGQSALIVVSDATRATGSAQIVNLLVRRLIQAGIPPARLAIIFATGIHRAVTSQEKLELVTSFIAQRIQLLDHIASNGSDMIDLGFTERGTPVTLNRALRDFDHVLIVGAIGFHYFAGFTGGRKSVCPGLASARTVEATHMLALDFENGGRRTSVGTGLLDGNPVHEECESIAAMINPSFAINSVVDEKGRAVHLYAGDWRAAHRRGCLEYASNHSVEIPGKRGLVIVSCGGSPYDINLIQAHKALDMAAYACREGGTIVLLAECPDGVGRADFLKWFHEPDSRALEMRLRQAYEVNGQTAWSLLTKAERFRVILVSELSPEHVRFMRMIPATSLEEALQETDRNVEGYLMPRGASWLPVERH